MPQASDKDRERYLRSFPDIGCEHAILELKRRGYEGTVDWEWIAPADHAPTEEELFWIGFLIREWDFGELVEGGDAE